MNRATLLHVMAKRRTICQNVIVDCSNRLEKRRSHLAPTLRALAAKMGYVPRPFVKPKRNKALNRSGISVVQMPNSPAGELIRRFGGAAALAHALFICTGERRSRSSVARWAYPHPKGRGGLIPASIAFDLKNTAKEWGVSLDGIDVPSLKEHKRGRGRAFKNLTKARSTT